MILSSGFHRPGAHVQRCPPWAGRRDPRHILTQHWAGRFHVSCENQRQGRKRRAEPHPQWLQWRRLKALGGSQTSCGTRASLLIPAGREAGMCGWLAAPPPAPRSAGRHRRERRVSAWLGKVRAPAEGCPAGSSVWWESGETWRAPGGFPESRLPTPGSPAASLPLSLLAPFPLSSARLWASACTNLARSLRGSP